jgi:MSHA biogenesis protein MshG
MPSFAYKARSARGDLIQGTIESGSIDAVAAQLINSGITPIDITETREDVSNIDIGKWLARNRPPTLQDLILFSRQMYTLMKAGVPMVRSITGLIQSTRNSKLIEALRDILKMIESGQELSTALARHPGIFTTLFVSMVRVGENTGRLDESFLQISLYMEREKETRERIKAALRYPAFVIVAIAIAIAIINIWVIPVFANLFAKAEVPLPWQTRLLINVSGFFVAWWPVMLGALAAFIVGFTQYTKTDAGLYRWEKFKLKIPLAGDIIKRATLARFSRAFAMALSAGVPLIQALTVVSRAVDNEYIADHILGMRNGIERGDSITRTATITGMFTPLVLQMLAVGEETGAVDDMLLEVAEYYEREVDYDIKNLSSAIEPILIVAIGIMVLILALGVFLPMWDMASVVR